MPYARRLALLLASLFFVVSQATTTPFAGELIPESAPRGARAVLAGRDLDGNSLTISFSSGGGSEALAQVVMRSATLVELEVPLNAISGPVHVRNGDSLIATFDFTVAAESPYSGVTTVAGAPSSSIFKTPTDVFVTATGEKYVTDTFHHQIKKIQPSGEVVLVAGTGSPGFANGPGPTAKFAFPTGITVDSGNAVLIADTGNHAIRKIAADGTVTTLAGSGARGSTDGPGGGARFSSPAGIALDAGGQLFVADAGGNKIRKVAPDGMVTTVAGSGTHGYRDGPAAQARFAAPAGVAVTPAGVLFIADTFNHVIRKIENGIVTTIAGAGRVGSTDGPVERARFAGPTGVALDDEGNLFVADTGNHRLRKISLQASPPMVSTFAGTGHPGYADGDLLSAQFKHVAGLSFRGALYIADAGNNAVRTVLPPLSVSDLWVRRGPIAGGNSIRIFGTGFVPGTAVKFGTVSAPAVSYVTSTELIATVPSNNGTVDLFVTTPESTKVLLAAYRYLPLPTISSVFPRKGPVGGGTSVTVQGSDFVDGDTRVFFSSAESPAVDVTGPFTASVIIPPGSHGAAEVLVRTPGGEATLAEAFSYFAPPEITAFSPMSGFPGTVVTISGRYFDSEAAGNAVLIGSLPATIISATEVELEVLVPMGAASGPISTTTAGGTTETTQPFVVPVPVMLAIFPASLALDPGDSAQLTAIATYSDGSTRNVTDVAIWTTEDDDVATVAAGLVQAVAAGTTIVHVTLETLAQSVNIEVTSSEILPPDPATVAPPLDPTAVTTLGPATEFLYTGANPIQTGVAAGTIEHRRVAVLRGAVKDRDGQPVPGVRITIDSHDEFGQTLTRADGMFDLAVNGGGLLTVRYEKPGYLTVDRQVKTPWQDYVWAPEVVLITLDPQVTSVQFPSTTLQVVRGSSVTDGDGTRRATLLFAPGTTATLALPDGTEQASSTLSIRATEYTIGGTGPGAMPADLPPQSGYTYCVELAADEAVAAAAQTVRFSQPVIFYLENFLGFPVGVGVPAGYYDRARAAWIASDDGRIVKVVSITDGKADLDLTGDGTADDPTPLSVTDDERRRLAELYSPGSSLWRVPITHFSPWDLNYGYGLPFDAILPEDWLGFVSLLDDPRRCAGSVIECENQVVGQVVPITGTPFSLHYQSDRVAGRKAGNQVRIQVSPAQVPASLERIHLDVAVNGTRRTLIFPTASNQTYDLSWEGTDAYGRTVQGLQTATVRLGYQYPAIPYEPEPLRRSFARFAGVPMSTNNLRNKIVLWSEKKVPAGVFAALPQHRMGGWGLSVLHSYDPHTNTLFQGEGIRRSADGVERVISRFAGVGLHGGDSEENVPAKTAQLTHPMDVEVAADGSVYLLDSDLIGLVRKVHPNGNINTVAGARFAGPGFSGDGGPAIHAQFDLPLGIALAPDGTLYVADRFNSRVRRIKTNGVIDTIAGPATPIPGVQLEPTAIAVGNDGRLIIGSIRRVYQLMADGSLERIAGNGEFQMELPPAAIGDGGPAIQARIGVVSGLAVQRDGTVYVADVVDHRIRHLRRDGTITTVAGTGRIGTPTEGGLATSTSIHFPQGLALGPDDALYFSEGRHFIRRLSTDGRITTVAGSGITVGSPLPFNNDSPPRAANLNSPIGLDFGPDGSLYVADSASRQIRRIQPTLTGTTVTENAILIPSEDGAEVFVFDGAGRHLRTLESLTGAQRYQFIRNTSGQVISILDAHGNSTELQRDASNNVVAIIAPFGQRSVFERDAHGYLSEIRNPAGEATRFSYTPDGLVTGRIDAAGHLTQYGYDSAGNMTRSIDAAAALRTLETTEEDLGRDTRLLTASGRLSHFSVQRPSGGGLVRMTRTPSGNSVTIVQSAGGNPRLTHSNGVIVEGSLVPDQRWRMQAPLTSNASIQLPSGLKMDISHSRLVLTNNADNPLTFMSINDSTRINGRLYRRRFESGTKLSTETSPAGRVVRTQFNGLGRISEVAIGDIAPTQYLYDSHGRISSVVSGGRSQLAAYDSFGRLASLTDPAGRTTSYEYDAADRLIRQAAPDGRAALFGYDSLGNLTTITPSGRPAHRFTYSSIGLESSYTSASGAARRYSYNLDRELTQIQEPDGSVVSFSYDTAGRLTSMATPHGPYSYGYGTDGGTLQSINGPDGDSTTLAYDGFILKSATSTGLIPGRVEYTYNNDFRLSSNRVGDSQAISFGYDEDNLLVTAGSLTLSRSPQNGLLTGSALNNLTDQYTYNTHAETTGYAAAYNATPFFSASYTRDPVGRITGKAETIYGITTTETYGYDTSGRLISTSRNGETVATYAYDVNSNRVSRVSPSESLAAVYDEDDRLLTYGTTSYTYNGNGQLANRTQNGSATQYTYDVFGNLRRVTLPAGSVVDYMIDGQNRRVGKKVDSVMKRGWIYSDRHRPIAEVDGSGVVTTRFVYASRSNVPDYMIKGGTTYRIVSDPIGSPRVIMDATTGAVMQRLDYDEFGVVLQDTNPGFQPFAFAGGLYDSDTKFTRFGARDYDAETGRWTTPDPIDFAGGSANLYAYAFSDPVNFIDPTGTLTLPFVGWVDVGENAGESAVDFYADILADPSIPWWHWKTVGAALGGTFASLWTPCTSDYTVMTLDLAAGAGVARHIAKPYWRYVGPKSNPNSRWLVRGWNPPYGSDFGRAKDALQIPNMPTGVERVNVRLLEPVRGPRSARLHPEWGSGRGPEHYRAWSWPEP